MAFNSVPTAGLAALAIMMALACNSEPQSAGGGASTKKPAKKVTNPVGDECVDDVCTSSSGDLQNAKVATGAKAVTPSSWCAAAAKTNTVSQNISDLFATLCKGSQATEFMVKTLVDSAFSGSGEPQLYAVQPISTANGTVSAFFAVAIKLPINAAKHFESVAPQDGSVETEKGKIKAQGSQPSGKITVTPTTSSDNNWVRGWTVDTSSSAQVDLATIKTSYVYQIDQFNFAEAGYLYTSRIKSSRETVTDYQILNAVLDITNNGYQFIVAKIAAKDQGHADQVTKAVKDIAAKLVKFSYSQATAAN